MSPGNKKQTDRERIIDLLWSNEEGGVEILPCAVYFPFSHKDKSSDRNCYFPYFSCPRNGEICSFCCALELLTIKKERKWEDEASNKEGKVHGNCIDSSPRL